MRIMRWMIVLGQTALEITGLPDVRPSRRFALKNVYKERQPPRVGLESSIGGPSAYNLAVNPDVHRDSLYSRANACGSTLPTCAT